MTLVELYIKRIKAGLMTLSEVPPLWKKAVENGLSETNEGE